MQAAPIRLAALSSQRYAALAEAATTPDERLLAYINARLAKGDGADPHAVAAWVMIGAEAVRQPEVREVYQDALSAEFTLLQNLLSAYIKFHGKRVKNVKHLAAGLLAFMEGAFQLASAAPELMPTGYAASTAVQFIRRYVECEMDS